MQTPNNDPYRRSEDLHAICEISSQKCSSGCDTTLYSQSKTLNELRDLWGDQVAATENVLEEYAAGVECGKLSGVDRMHLNKIALSSQEKVAAISRFPELRRGGM